MKFKVFAVLSALAAGLLVQVPAMAVDGYYRMQTMFLEGEGRCFESNRLDAGSTLGGASFMDRCQDVSGQYWRLVPEANGYYRLQSMFLERENKCLEGNGVGPGSTLGGAAFMDNCQNVTGQLWRLMPNGDGHFRLTTMSWEGKNKCLEGNRVAPGAFLGGAAFMADCQNVSGQLWKFILMR